MKNIPDWKEVRDFAQKHGIDIFKSDAEIEKEEREKSEQRRADVNRRVLN